MTNTPLVNTSRMSLRYKQYASNVIIPGTPPVPSTDPGSTGGLELRRQSSSLNLAKSSMTSSEVRPDLQIADFRHGGRRVPGDIMDEISPLTFQDYFAAGVRGTWAAGPSITQSTYTSLAATNSTGKFTLGASTWVAAGFKVGDIFRPSGVAAPNNGANFMILSMSGVDAFVYPAPADMVADTTFGVALAGRKVIAPDEGSYVIPKFLIEHNYPDNDVSHLFLECLVGQTKVSFTEKFGTVQFTLLGRDMQALSGAGAPFFTAPTAPTTTTLLTSFGGFILAAGVPIIAVTQVDLTIDLKQSGPEVAFDNFMPAIFTNAMIGTGTVSGFYSDDIMRGDFDAETEIDIALMGATAPLTISTGNPSLSYADFIKFYMPRVKLSGFNITNSGTAGAPFTAPFSFYRKATSTGYDSTTIGIQDSLSA